MNYVLTHHYSTNAGTVAQALCAAISTGSFIINYTHPDRVRMFEHCARCSEQELQILNWNKPLTQRFQFKEEAWEFIDDPETTVFVGSDEVLKFDPEGGSSNRSLQEYPTVHYLPEWTRCRKVLLSGCLGIPPGSIPKWFYRDIGRRLEQFEVISVRDTDTWTFLDDVSPSLSQRTQIIPDPTWTLYPNTLEQTPLKFYRGLKKASSYHRLISMLMQHQKPEFLTDQRRKTVELARRFHLQEWSLHHVQNQCLEEKERYQKFVEQVLSSQPTGLPQEWKTGRGYSATGEPDP